jgi:UDP-glucose 4-epimerase
MNILITGGAGFIGSHLAERLLARGDKVLVIDNYATGRRDNLAPHANLQIVEGTIADGELVDKTFDSFKPELVIHAAASYKDPENWAEDARTNVLGTVNIVKAAKRVEARRLIYFQTALCYGLRPLEQPITLNHPILPDGSSYAISKTSGEHYIKLSGLDFVSFRLANVFGPRNLSGPLPTFYNRLSSGKACFVSDTRRDFLYVEDLCEVVMLAADGKGKGFYHISSGGDVAIKELYEATTRALGLPSDGVEVRPRNPDDVESILLDPSRTNADFNWKASTPLTVGVDRAIAWYKSHGVTETFTHLKAEEARVKQVAEPAARG